MRTVDQIIEDAGGVTFVSAHLPQRSRWAVYKWKAKGIPSRHWPVLIKLADATADELLAANMAVTRPPEQGDAA